jgi:ubiquinol-cytochrome c reductase cytochrome c subunit
MRLASSLLLSLAFGSSALAAGSAEKGKAAYVKHGCWQCHGLAAQGGVTGPKLAPNPMAAEAFSVFVRFSKGAMPPYQKAILPDEDLADIHAYLQSLPKAPDYKSIPLLNQ